MKASVRPIALMAALAALSVVHSSAAEPQMRVRAKPFCHRFGEELAVQSIIDVDYRYPKGAAETMGRSSERVRQLWSITCSLGTRQCEAVLVNVSRIERGEELELEDVAKVKGMSVAAQTGAVVTLVWGPYRTLVLDLKARTIEYRESGPAAEGRGVGACGPG